mmetsp:Transcript_108562/g.259151  ORF Transcript_108562/g.259151 Transcript_108562/m.259151 type:complete len:1412 (+) Transcript_108562:82-4317(+)|eukprot:CAMPEP_0181423378 /NCGR_PEP_ID=MMETSP1110-20121109/14098_1 /TAXON_ID=174948 /ORGANISM="Symbiodinium sp., Strain CCMP421" /LENGTH=1411 /DNA_ID=CAMNT_0023546503 /DNA_START=81 /DNA_END=4316 /DNA_ORIENTATION=+
MGAQCCSYSAPIPGYTGASHEEMLKNFGDLSEDAGMASVVAALAQITEEHPYLKPMGTEPTPHQLLYWVRRCREFIILRNPHEAMSCVERINRSLKYEIAQILDAFRRFDHDSSGHLDQAEFKYLCAYLGWGEEEARLMDMDADQKVTAEEFRIFVGHMGGLAQLFEHRRQRVASKNWGEDAPAVIQVGARIRAFYYTEDGKKSSSWREAQVLEMNVMPENGVRLLFGFGEETSERQVVPPSWIFFDSRDSEVVSALREVGILEEQQAFWASIFPQSEMRAVAALVPCQRQALAHVRANASMNHDKAMPAVRQRFNDLGYGEEQLQAVLGWIQDLAPMCIHVHIDNVGRFLETDEFYRNQFETGTSCGALDDGNSIRKGWEKELFGGCYDDAKPFERCKYGALSVMNDYRGVLSAYQYGDSYLVLKDVRLRTSFAATDSGGIEGDRLAVLDKYAHVLKEYGDRELRELIEVASANTSLMDVGGAQPKLIRGMSTDCASEWVTVGFPDLPQKKGRYYFEVELYRGCRSAQVGFLSNHFIIAPKTAGYQGGVGDDEHGWAVDGQHALRWHGGKKLPWDRYWEVSPEDPNSLNQNVMVGVAVDIDARAIWFASDGVWDEEKTPSFGTDLIPKGTSVYPAVSLKGRACFNFGPDFAHKAPAFKGRTFAAWPGMPDGKVRADVPIIGDENNVGIYKEIQIHGEVSLKNNVQRLVANRKYLDRSKDARSWAIIVDGLGAAEGTYARTGADKGASIFSQRDGPHVMLCDMAKKIWKVVPKDKTDEILASAPLEEGRLMDPPRSGWMVPPESRGSVTQAVFKQAMKEVGVSDTDCKTLITALGSDSKVFRFRQKTSFVAEWAKLKHAKTAEEAWAACVSTVQKALMQEHGIADGKVFETQHPYPAKSARHSQTVKLEGCERLQVTFSNKCRTYDSCANFSIRAGSLSKATAGVGARIQAQAFASSASIHGTLTGRLEGDKWSARIDHDEVEISGQFREWLEADTSRQSFVILANEVKTACAYYEDSQAGSEIAGFSLDMSAPMAPFSIAGFKSDGPAQQAGAMIGWYLDVDALLGEDEFLELEVPGLPACPNTWEEASKDLPGFQKRLDFMLQEAADIELVFFNGLDFKLLPAAYATYDKHPFTKPGDEIAELESNGETVCISSFKQDGPAKESGARETWQLNLVETFRMDSNKRVLGELTRQQVLESPNDLLELEGLKLMFEPQDASSTSYFHGCNSDFESLTVPTNCIELYWETDGDGRHDPESRWGVFALITADKGKPVDQSVLDSLTDKYLIETLKAKGHEGNISVEPEDWDETRLRALCARHGWQFEWMTEEGEKKRRIDGAGRARKMAEKAAKKDAGGAGGAAWWRLDSVVKAFAFGNGNANAQNKPKIQPPTQPKRSVVDEKVTQAASGRKP